MDPIISDLVTQFERGLLTRRQLIQGLTALATAGVAAPAAAQGSGLQAARIDHISIQVADLARAVDFYRQTFGLSVVGEDKPNEIVRLGMKRTLVSLHHKSPTGVVDHFAIGLDQFNKEAVTQQLKQRGLTPSENLDAGFHIVDPEGISVQIM